MRQKGRCGKGVPEAKGRRKRETAAQGQSQLLIDGEYFVEDPLKEFNEAIKGIRSQDDRYARGAYYFVRQALDYTLKSLQKEGILEGNAQISGQQLLGGIREYGVEQFGPMARSVFNHWGVKTCKDFGNIVFNLVETRILGKADEDSIEDFDGGYDFREAFDAPFRPKRIKPTTRRPRAY